MLDGGCGERLIAGVRFVLVPRALSAAVVACADGPGTAVDAGKRHGYIRCCGGSERPGSIDTRRPTRGEAAVRVHVALWEGGRVAVSGGASREREQRGLGRVQHDPPAGTAAA